MASEAPYPLRQALRLAGLPRRFVDDLVQQGVISPQPGQHFSHQDVVVLRTARELRDAGVPPRQVVQALRQLQGSLNQVPLSGVRLRAHAGHVEALTPDRRRIDARTGQGLLPFDDDDAGSTGGVRALPVLADAGDAAQWLQRAIALEAVDPAAAEAAYRRTLALDVRCAAAYVNLGALLCESHRSAEAVELYEQALLHCPATPLVHYNRATALEDLDLPWQAVFAYKRALELDPQLADAHYNLATLLQRLGDRQGSLRHLSAYRRHRL
jgi:tetratricopeptide (TPR) repeat protein